MKIRHLFLIVVSILPVTTRGDFTIVQKVEGVGPLNQITTKLKGDKANVEVSPETTMIIDSKSGEMLTVLNGQKKFLRVSGENYRAIAELINKNRESSAAAAKPKLTPTGKKETINGYETEEYVRESGDTSDSYWIALKLPESAAILKQLQAMIPAALNNIAKGIFDFGDFPGLPIRTIIKKNGSEIISTITSIKRDPLSDAEFSVPKDFQEIKTPGLKEVLSRKPPRAPSTNP